MNKRRLLKLADLLEKDARRKRGIRFNMRTWGNINNPKKPLSCGTQACAMGLAALSGAFRHEGLSAVIREDGDFQFKVSGKKTYNGFRASRKFFRINSRNAERLFEADDVGLPDEGRGARAELAVAKRIRDFVAGKATFSEPGHR